MERLHGLELFPPSRLVRPKRAACFHSHAYGSGELVGLMVGARKNANEPWQPALDSVTVEAVVVHGVSLHIGPIQGLVRPGDIGYPLFARVRDGQTLVVYVRNNARELRELRAVLVTRGALSLQVRSSHQPSTPRTSRKLKPGKRSWKSG